MTIALTIRISNALILATDSSSTIMEIENDIPRVHQTYFNADKLFNLKKNEPIGCLTWGDGSINGIPISSLTKDFRDELEIDVKAKFDGEYAAALNAGKFKGFAMDVKCFFGTVVSVLKSDGVVEGGTGEIRKQEEKEKETIEQ